MKKLRVVSRVFFFLTVSMMLVFLSRLLFILLPQIKESKKIRLKSEILKLHLLKSIITKDNVFLCKNVETSIVNLSFFVLLYFLTGKLFSSFLFALTLNLDGIYTKQTSGNVSAICTILLFVSVSFSLTLHTNFELHLVKKHVLSNKSNFIFFMISFLSAVCCFILGLHVTPLYISIASLIRCYTYVPPYIFDSKPYVCDAKYFSEFLDISLTYIIVYYILKDKSGMKIYKIKFDQLPSVIYRDTSLSHYSRDEVSNNAITMIVFAFIIFRDEYITCKFKVKRIFIYSSICLLHKSRMFLHIISPDLPKSSTFYDFRLILYFLSCYVQASSRNIIFSVLYPVILFVLAFNWRTCFL